MTLEEGVRSFLEADVRITALVGTRIIPAQFDQTIAFPLITYVRISSNEPQTHDGWIGWARVRMQFNVYADAESGSFATALSVNQALKLVLRGFPKLPQLIGERNTVEPQSTIHYFQQDWMFWWTE